MSTVPFAQPGQTGMPGNTPLNTTPMDFSFLQGNTSYNPVARQRAAAVGQQPSTTATISNPFSNITGIPSNLVPFTGNNYQSATSINNPFSDPNNNLLNFNSNSMNELSGIFGPIGTTFGNYLNQGAGYNTAVLNSLINQIQPQVQSQVAQLGATAGMTGNRFGSAYETGLANYLSQVNQNELGMASQLYQHSQDTINSDLMNILPEAWQYTNNQGSIWPFLLASLIPLLGNIPGLGGKKPPVKTPPITPSPTPTVPTAPTTPTTFPPGNYPPDQFPPQLPTPGSTPTTGTTVPPGSVTTTTTDPNTGQQVPTGTTGQEEQNLLNAYNRGVQTGDWSDYWNLVSAYTGGTPPIDPNTGQPQDPNATTSGNNVPTSSTDINPVTNMPYYTDQFGSTYTDYLSGLGGGATLGDGGFTMDTG